MGGSLVKVVWKDSSSSSSLRGWVVQAASGGSEGSTATSTGATCSRRRLVEEEIRRRWPLEGRTWGGLGAWFAGADEGRGAVDSSRNGRTRRIDIRSQWWSGRGLAGVWCRSRSLLARQQGVWCWGRGRGPLTLILRRRRLQGDPVLLHLHNN